MITNNEIHLLQGLTKEEPVAVKLESGDKALVFSRWFVLELPLALFDPDFDNWEEEASDAAKGWRTLMPPGEGDYAQAMRWVNPKDSVVLIRLIGDSGTALIHPSIYDVVTKQLPEPEFRVFSGEKPYVAIFSAGVMVGGAAQMKV